MYRDRPADSSRNLFSPMYDGHLVRRPLEAEFDTASRLRFGVPAVAYGSAVNEEGGAGVAEWASIVVNLPMYDGHLVRRPLRRPPGERDSSSG